MKRKIYIGRQTLYYVVSEADYFTSVERIQWICDITDRHCKHQGGVLKKYQEQRRCIHGDGSH